MSLSAQPHLRIRLLGDFNVTLDGKPLGSLDQPRLQSLLAYLVLNREAIHRRSHIAFAFWPDSEEKKALASFRNLLHSLRQALPHVDSILDINSQTIAWKADATYALDVEEFEEVLASENANRSQLKKAVEVYRGELLPKLDDEWIEPIREQIRLGVNKVLSQLINKLREEGDFAEAIEYSKKRIRFDELSEQTHYELIELHVLNSDRTAALLAYKACASVLKEDLGIEPRAELQDLYQRILDGAFESKKPFSTSLPSVGNDVGEGNGLDSVSSSQPSRYLLKLVMFGFVSAVIAIVWFSSFEKSEYPTPSDKSIAVLPFENRSNLEEDAFFTDGVHDDLITRISRIHGLKTISRTSVMEYRSAARDLKQIGQELGVARIIEGGVQRSGDEVRVNIQLIDTATGFHLWAKTYTKEMTAESVFGIQSEITEAVAEELRVVLTLAEQKRSEILPTQNFEALEAYFRGIALREKGTSESYIESIEYLKKAIELDPAFAIAHVILADAYIQQIHVLGLSVEEQSLKAEPHISKALELDDSMSRTYVALGRLKQENGDLLGAEEAFQHAIELNPNEVAAYLSYSSLKHFSENNPKEAVELIRKALELDPNNNWAKRNLAMALTDTGGFEEARTVLELLLKEDPENTANLHSLAFLYKRGFNEYDEAIRIYRRAHAIDPPREQFPMQLTHSYYLMGDLETAIFWLERKRVLAPNSVWGNFFTALSYELKGEIEESLVYFEKVKIRNGEWMYGYSIDKLVVSDLRTGKVDTAYNRFLDAYPWLSDPDCTISKLTQREVITYTYLLAAVGEHEKVKALAERILIYLPSQLRMGKSYEYWDAMVYIALGDHVAAIQAVREYVNAGGCSSLLADDFYLKAIADEPEFQELVAIVESRLAEQREHVIEMEVNGELAVIPEI